MFVLTFVSMFFLINRFKNRASLCLRGCRERGRRTAHKLLDLFGLDFRWSGVYRCAPRVRTNDRETESFHDGTRPSQAIGSNPECHRHA